MVIFPGVSVTSSPVTGQRGVRLPGGERIFCIKITLFLFCFSIQDVVDVLFFLIERRVCGRAALKLRSLRVSTFPDNWDSDLI